MKKSVEVDNKDRQEDKVNNRDNRPFFNNSFNDINGFLKILVVGQSYIIIISILTLFFEGYNVSSRVVVSQILGLNIGFLIPTLFHILKK